jgi:hypothetical protein
MLLAEYQVQIGKTDRRQPFVRKVHTQRQSEILAGKNTCRARKNIGCISYKPADIPGFQSGWRRRSLLEG